MKNHDVITEKRENEKGTESIFHEIHALQPGENCILCGNLLGMTVAGLLSFAALALIIKLLVTAPYVVAAFTVLFAGIMPGMRTLSGRHAARRIPTLAANSRRQKR